MQEHGDLPFALRRFGLLPGPAGGVPV
jgi:hypothetical protein